jgi:hypothetical protein
MRFNRRQFIKIGAAGALTAAGCTSSPEQGAQSPAPAQSPALGAELKVDFEGLYIIEGHGAATKIRMIEGSMVGVPTHLLQMRALASAIDQTQTTKPDAAHVVPVGGDFFWFWDLKGNDVTMPKADSGPDDLTSEDSSSEDGQDVPTTESGWHSLKRVPDLKVLCGATKVTNMAAVASTVALKHGHFGVLKPSGAGETAIWKFVKSDGTELTPPGHKALSNKVRYTRSNSGNQLHIEIGTQKIYFKPNVTTGILITNLMPSTGPCPAPCTPNMNHFTAFLQMVNKAFDSKAELVLPFTPVGGGAVEPDYCPGSRV